MGSAERLIEAADLGIGAGGLTESPGGDAHHFSVRPMVSSGGLSSRIMINLQHCNIW